ncbi:Tube1 [Symbiodinium necroappetens]|uniref:Tube1 protein n=1 Tax=Symbiodinium necroappetens TaxID=1628268 RepID=A0A812LCF8_9DINO|nr:Tube1 [Symbiodinium necroappetens]
MERLVSGCRPRRAAGTPGSLLAVPVLLAAWAVCTRTFAATGALLKDLQAVYCIRRRRRAELDKALGRLSLPDHVPIRQWEAVDGFNLQDDILEIVDSGVVEPAALPRILVKEDWRKMWRETRRWRHVRRSREAPGKKHGGWLRQLDLTRGSLGQGLSQLQVWADIEREAKSPDAVYLVVEETCMFLPNLDARLLEERLQSLPDDWEIACLAGTDLLGNNPDTDLEQVQAHNVAPGLKRLHPWFRIGPAYFITAAGARKALRTCTPLRWRLDCQLVGRFASTHFGEDAFLDIMQDKQPSGCSETGW